MFEGRQRYDCNGRDFLNSQLRLNQDRKKDKKDGTKKERRKSDRLFLPKLTREQRCLNDQNRLEKRLDGRLSDLTGRQGPLPSFLTMIEKA